MPLEGLSPRPLRLPGLVCALLLAGCPGQSAAPPDAGPGTSPVDGLIPTPAIPGASDWNAVPWPRTDGGAFVLFGVPGGELRFDPTRTPLSAVVDCTRLIAGCVSPVHSLDDCIVAMPACATQQPWTEPAICCPTTCRDAYQAARAGGMAALPAFQATYFRRSGCFPGIPVK